ncbi:MAG: G1 family glutamic endopeptidase [Acidimicrobiales bacterium]
MGAVRRVAAALMVGGCLVGIGGTAAGAGGVGAPAVRHEAGLVLTDRSIGVPDLTPTLRATAKAPVAPSVTKDPASITVGPDKKATFKAAAAGKPKPTVQWEVSTDGGHIFTAAAGATSKTYSFTAASDQSGDEYEAVFTSSAGAATTTAATLWVSGPPVVATAPTSATVASGGTAMFSATASGLPAPTVQWEVSTDGGETFTAISGATSASYSFIAATNQSGDQYEAVFTNPYGAVTTTAATLTVDTPPAVTADPAGIEVVPGGTATFSAGASGMPAPSVQWEVSTDSGTTFTTIAGATATTYTFTATAGESGDEYEAVFANPVGTATTTAATLTVVTPPPVETPPTVTTSPTSETVVAGGTATFSAGASATPAPTVQWEVSTNGGTTFTTIAGATATTYTFTTTAGESGDEYEAVFTNPAGTAMTTAATLSVTSVPSTRESTNWSGYAGTGSGFDAVTGRWMVPAVTCTGTSTTYSSEWIGIDGDTSSSVEQDGTEADCLGGTPSYDAWYELYGDSSQNGGDEIELSRATYPVSPGDSMTASVTEAAGAWTFVLEDVSNAHADWSFTSEPIAFSAAQSSAEWIIERPEICGTSCSLASLADFGSATMAGCTASTAELTAAPIDAFPSTAIEMVNRSGSHVLAAPSALSASGTSFSDTWKASN